MPTKETMGLYLVAISTVLLLTMGAHAREPLPYGLDMMSQFEKLPYLRRETMAGQSSSHNRASPDCWGPSCVDEGVNGFDRGHYLYSIGAGNHREQVLVDLAGSGTIYRMWFTGNTNPVVRIYFDTDTDSEYSIAINFRDMFSGTREPFLAPLVVDDTVSSGGFVSYLPIPFSSGIRVTLADNDSTSNDDTQQMFFDIGYHLFSPDTAVENWLSADDAYRWKQAVQDSTSVRDMWNRAGLDPKPRADGTVKHAGTHNLRNSPLVLNFDGPRSIQSLRFRIPGVFPEENPGSMRANGKAFKGYSTFDMGIEANNQGVILKRRLDYGVGNQKAGVYVDNHFVGYWSTPGRDQTHRWRDSSFYIPRTDTKNKSSISIRVQYLSSDIDWNEFDYRVYSIVGGKKVQTDSLDVGNAMDEQRHNYAIAQQRWSGTRDYKYPTLSAQAAETLKAVRLRIQWDDEPEHSVDSPFHMLFATGNNNVYPTRSLPVGIDEMGYLYLYFPMPFQRSAKITVEGDGSSNVPDLLAFEIDVSPFSAGFDDVAYFRTRYQKGVKSQVGKDLTILREYGQGHFVGNVISYYGAQSGHYLEGDERIHVDDGRSPSIYGTGAEDYFNGGWYFNAGFFSNPLSGLTGTTSGKWDRSNITSATAYRFMLQDAIPFKFAINAGIEHGNYNEKDVTADILAFYYLKKKWALIHTDELNINDSSSETEHSYRIHGQSWSGQRVCSFEGDRSDIQYRFSGRAFRGAGSHSEFVAAIRPDNKGVLLTRVLDQTIGRQRASVYVDGDYVGDWYTADENSYHRWRADTFFIPPIHAEGKTALDIQIAFVSSELDWNEFRYNVYSYVP